jgi:hypothetical protein
MLGLPFGTFLFMNLFLSLAENYELIKNSQPVDAPSKDAISIVAKQWANTTEDEKNVWKARAEQMKDQLYLDDDEVGLSVPPPSAATTTNKRASASPKKQSAKKQQQQQQQQEQQQESSQLAEI